jgi:iron complex outermembrane receptor protein
VLKDASATAIYGSRGANGVILIQTKRGSARAATGLRYEGYAAAASPTKELGYLDGNGYRDFVQQQITAGKLDPSRAASLGTANTDWEKEVTRTGYSQNHNISFAGGTEATKYRASLNYFEQQGVVTSSGIKRYQGRLNGLHSTFGGKLGVGLASPRRAWPTTTSRSRTAVGSKVAFSRTWRSTIPPARSPW